ncbi:sigma-70 family RNA polymerase sigma factor [Spirosoma sp. KCTC 42546]|uniref:RNA polymerase sigma factor n=1 Tax=Spirosoma sp. KCTC 42546 TaxID=2520506 RepID=UPI0011582962|nr:sigma-70 family RNA polymerase sigma factor [Spirosoma sp. KCTC 42546]QDK79002.1 sigma-70 family RNA polymerase sigma factor [Spirosoma sp. KCTC 42546]
MLTLFTDEEVILQFSDSHPRQCFETLYKRYFGKVYRRCLSMTRDHELAQDFAHDIFLKVFAKLDAFQQRSSFSTWLYAISYNYCSDQLRLAKRLKFDSLDNLLKQDIPDSDFAQLHEEKLQLVRDALAQLTMNEQALLHLKYEDGLTVNEIAGLYSLKDCTVKMRLKRSRDRMHKWCTQQYAYPSIPTYS